MTAKRHDIRGEADADSPLTDEEFVCHLVTVLIWIQATPEIDPKSTPNVKAYLDRMRARPSMAAALATEIPLFRAEIARRKAA